MKSDTFFMQTVTDGSTQNAQAFGVDVEYPNDRYSGSLDYRDVGSRFSPGLGGALRKGIRQWKGDFRYRTRPGNWMRTVDSEIGFDIVTNRDADLETATATFNFLTTGLLELQHEQAMPPDTILFYDVRRANCIALISDD